MPKGTPLTEAELERKRREIFDAAMRLFVEKGFNETSMRDIAAATGLGKSTLYDYFPSKDEILIEFVVDEVRHISARIERIIAQETSVVEMFRRILAAQMEYLLANKQMYLRISLEAQRLSTEGQARIQRHRHAYQDRLCALVEEGIRRGELRPVNPLMAIRGMFSFVNAAAYTTRPTGSPEEMVQQALDIVFKGLEAETGKVDPGG